MDIGKIFPFEEEIPLTDDFLTNVDIRRKRYSADTSLIKRDPVVIDINNIAELPDGRLRIDINGAHFECFFHKGSSDKMYIHLNNAIQPKERKKQFPRFARWSWYTLCDHSWLSIEDPVYYDSSDIVTGWFYGTAEKNYREYVALIAEKICGFLGIDKSAVCFYGSSSGGTAAIHCAALFGGIAVAINPQLNFEYNHVQIDKFRECIGIDLHLPDKFRRNDLCGIMKDSPNARFILFENCRSEWDINDHLKYACSRLNITPSYGLTQFGNIVIHIYDAPETNGPAHNSVENKTIFFVIDFLVEAVRSGENIKQLKPLFLLLNEFWRDSYIRKKEKIRVSENECLTEVEIIEKLGYSRRQRIKLNKKLEQIKAVIESD